ncbi:MAG: hypothetical protein ABJC13_08795 [Acidobacteriota bacterium]
MSLIHCFSSRRCAFLAIGFAAVAGFALAAPAAVKADEVSRVIAIQVYAQANGEDDSTLYGVAPENEPVDVSAGQRLRLTLVGTGLVDGTGEEIEIPASFNVAAGPSVDIIGRGSNWVDVSIRRNASGVAGQIGYRVGDDYEMRGEIRTGWIVLQVEEEEEEEE